MSEEEREGRKRGYLMGVFFSFFCLLQLTPPPRNLVPEIQVRAEEEDKEMITEMMMKQQNDLDSDKKIP